MTRVFGQLASGVGIGGIALPTPGGVPAGIAIFRQFSFAYNTAGLAAGLDVGWTPAVGDVLYDAWLSIPTAWDGTTPQGDIGTFAGGPSGLLAANPGYVLDMTQADVPVGGGMTGMGQAGSLQYAANLVNVQHGIEVGVSPALKTVPFGPGTGAPSVPPTAPGVPVRFTAANPFKVCVSQDGSTTGGSPGATQGAAILYLLTGSPA